MNPPKMPIHIGDYKRDTGHLRAAGHGAYLLLLFHHWSTGSLPDDDEQLSAIACMSPAEWKRARPLIEKFFNREQPGVWVHGRVEKDLASANESYQKRAKAGSEGGKAKATAKQSYSNATARLQQPLTDNQDTKEEKKETRVPALDDGWPSDYREQFWQAYPNKVGKPKALAKLDGIRKRGVVVAFTDIMVGLGRYIQTKPPDRAWLNPETFLNQERWADQPAAVAQQGNSNGRRTVQDAANDLIDRLSDLDAPAPGGLRGPEGEGAIRLLPSR